MSILGQSIRLEWRDQPDPPNSRRSLQASTSAAVASDGFTTHQVSRRDTLAGIALKYNVPPADIKRFNGLLSDTDLYGHTSLLIPTKLQPVGDDIRQLFTQVATRIGRDPVLNAEPAVHTQGRNSGSFSPMGIRFQGRGRAEDLPWWCQCGMCRADDDPSTTCRRLTSSSSQAGHVELVELQDRASWHAAAGPRTSLEQMRRRYQPGQGEEGVDAGTDPPHAARPGYPDAGDRLYASPEWQGRIRTGAPARSNGSPAAALLSSLGNAIAESGSALVQKLMRVASPAGSQRSARASVETPTASSSRLQSARNAFSRPGAPGGGPDDVPLSTPAKGFKDD